MLGAVRQCSVAGSVLLNDINHGLKNNTDINCQFWWSVLVTGAERVFWPCEHRYL